jgi:putative hydrolase of HD superfamily
VSVPTDAAIRLGQLALAFGRVDRITYHPDGVTPESDTDHTVMLGLIACAIAEQVDPRLDVGLVAQMVLVHDLVEVYAGDTPTIRALDADGRAAKEARERAALERITDEFMAVFPWLPSMIAAYESQRTREARYVKALDKATPKITHVLNGCATPIEQGLTHRELVDQHEAQLHVVSRYAGDMPALIDLLRDLMQASEDAQPGPNPDHDQTDSGCSSCGTCLGCDGCADLWNPLDPDRGDCAECGACGPCIRSCAAQRRTMTSNAD